MGLIASGAMTNLLHHVLATERRVKREADEAKTHAHRILSTPSLFIGEEKTYKPKDADGEKLSPQRTPLARDAKEVLAQPMPAWIQKIDTIAAKDDANTRARADVIVNGSVFLEAVPAVHLLFLEKELDDMRKLLENLPQIDGAGWTHDPATGTYRSEPIEQTKMAKVRKALVAPQPNDKFPAQTEFYSEDVVIGWWTAVREASAFTPTEVRRMLGKVRILHAAVKRARETANTVPVNPIDEGRKIMDFVMGDIVDLDLADLDAVA